MALNTCEMWSIGIKIAFFPKKLQKIAQRLGASPPDPPKPPAPGGPAPNPRLWYIWVTLAFSHVPKVGYLHFSTISLSLFPLQNPGYVPTDNNNFRSSILRYLCPTKTSSLEKFWWRHSMWFLWFKSPPIKNSGYANKLEMVWKKFLKTFFFLENACACVLGPWPWPRAFLSLASRGSVLGEAVLGLGLGFFLCPWPWPRALCPRLHLW